MKARKEHAFTVLELMIAVTILAVLATLGMPAFQQFSQRQAIRAAVTSLHSDLLLARSRAIYEDLSVLACPGTPLGGCTGETEWSGGWIVFADENADRDFQDDELLIRQGMAVERLVMQSSSGRNSFRFYPDGSAPGSNGSISFCGPAGPAMARKLIISNLGRIRREDAPELSPSNCPRQPN